MRMFRVLLICVGLMGPSLYGQETDDQLEADGDDLETSSEDVEDATLDGGSPDASGAVSPPVPPFESDDDVDFEESDNGEGLGEDGDFENAQGDADEQDDTDFTREDDDEDESNYSAGLAGSSTGSTVSGRQNLFGSYRVRIGFNKPDFDDGLKYYEDLYGTTSVYPTIQADWFAWDYYVTLGLSFQFGFYNAEGSTSKSDPREGADIVKDDNGPSSLTLIPLQLSVISQFTPFDGKWVVIDARIGYESVYWQEVRTDDGLDASATVRPQVNLLQDEESSGGSTTSVTTTEDDTLTNRGFKSATVIGLSANFLLNPLDEQSTNSMRGSMGLGSVYLSPFVEIVRTLTKKGASFGRSIFGVGFTFETTD